MSQDLSTWQEIALVAGPVAAAIAALASWASVWQARRLSREASMPDLVVQKIIDKQTQTIGAIVTNTGSGTARGVGIYLAFPPYYASGALGHGFMAPGDRVQVSTPIPTTEGVETDVLVLCRDSRGISHFWNQGNPPRIEDVARATALPQRHAGGVPRVPPRRRPRAATAG